MKYLFIDLEASNFHHQASICSIGFILCDEALNIITEEEILINPKTAFKLPPTFKIDIKEEQLINQPAFPKIYKRLKELFADDTLLIGHGFACDVKRLIASCNRYHLPPLKFSFLCSQIVYCAINQTEEKISLSKLAASVNYCFTPHNSLADAKAVYYYIKHLTRLYNCRLDQLIARFNIQLGYGDRKVSLCFSQELENKKFFSLLQTNSIADIKTKHFTNLVASRRSQINADINKDDKIFLNKTITFNAHFEQNNNINLMILTVYSLGGQYSKNINKCHIYVASANKDSDRRLKNLEKKIKIISEDDFINQIKRFFPIVDHAFTFLIPATL